MKELGDDLAALFREARQQVLIVAPFIRSNPLARLFDCIRSDVDITVVTRWRPVDLLVGASDLGVYDLAASRNVLLYLRNDLHAKMYASDETCLLGSANVTLTALGWRTPANLEILTPVERTSPNVVAFEKALFSRVTRATVAQRNRLQALLDRLQGMPILRGPQAEFRLRKGPLPSDWWPRVRNPEELFLLYRGDHDMSQRTLQIMEIELGRIELIPGMDEEAFRDWVGAAISATPLVEGVIRVIDAEGHVSEDVVANLLEELDISATGYPPRQLLEILQRWLTYFLPGQYETVQDSVKLIKSRPL